MGRPVFSFRQAQAAFDLIAFLQSADEARLAHLGDEWVGQVIFDQNCRFETEADAECYAQAVSAVIDDKVGADLAVGLIIANDLQSGLWSGEAREVAEIGMSSVLGAEHRFRAAVLRGLDVLGESAFATAPVDQMLAEQSRLTQPVDQILPGLCKLAKSLDIDTRRSVAAADFGDAADRHFEALQQVLSTENCLFPRDECWYPREVVELVSHTRETRGFVGCTALLLANALQGRDNQGWFEFRWFNLAADYNTLPDSARGPVLAGLRYLYESGQTFMEFSGGKPCDPVHAPEGMIHFANASVAVRSS